MPDGVPLGIKVVPGVVAHAKSSHDRSGPLVEAGRVSYNLRKTDPIEGEVEYGRRSLGGIAMTPCIGSKVPPDVDQGTVGSILPGKLEPNEAYDPLVFDSFDRPLAESMLVEASFDLVDELVALPPSQWLEAVAHDLRIGVDLREHLPIVGGPAAQQETPRAECRRLHGSTPTLPSPTPRGLCIFGVGQPPDRLGDAESRHVLR